MPRQHNTKKADARPPSNVVNFPNTHTARICKPRNVEVRIYIINDEYLLSEGIRPGMVIVGRALERGERPAPGAICAVRYERTGRVVVKKVESADEHGVTLTDDTGARFFPHAALAFDAVALHACSCDLNEGRRCEPVYLGAPAVDERSAEAVM